MDIIAFSIALFKETFSMLEILSTWRFIAILITIVLFAIAWKLPEIISAIRWW